jgi:hypothetical protein
MDPPTFDFVFFILQKQRIIDGTKLNEQDTFHNSILYVKIKMYGENRKKHIAINLYPFTCCRLLK